ncbi:MAG: mannose-6-phosphate isomerase, class I [Acidimicrobiales bacterium]
MLALRNPVQRYDWGSPDRLATFLGEPPDGRPQAELWIGAHPSAPSLARLTRRDDLRVDDLRVDGIDEDGTWVPLDQLIAGDPQRWVGAEVLARFGPVLPFLFKVLAAAQPLSLQLHPDQAAAHDGFAAEEAAGIPLDHPARRYRDPNHKPELLVALDGFEVLSGFRPGPEIADLFAAFGLPSAWVALAGRLEPGDLCERLWQLDRTEAATLVELVIAAAGSPERVPADSSRDEPGRVRAAAAFPAECDFVRAASACHPGDIGVVVGLCLNRTSLRPTEGAFAEPGVLHSYLGGFGLEIMANSDNVLRGGLTTKVVDVPELRRHLVSHATTPRRLIAHAHHGDGGVEQRFEVLVDEFALSSLHPGPGAGPDVAAMIVRAAGPEILLCVADEVAITVDPAGAAVFAETTTVLRRGQSVFVPAGHGTYRVSGAGSLYRAQVGIHARRLWADQP